MNNVMNNATNNASSECPSGYDNACDAFAQDDATMQHLDCEHDRFPDTGGCPIALNGDYVTNNNPTCDDFCGSLNAYCVTAQSYDDNACGSTSTAATAASP